MHGNVEAGWLVAGGSGECPRQMLSKVVITDAATVRGLQCGSAFTGSENGRPASKPKTASLHSSSRQAGRQGRLCAQSAIAASLTHQSRRSATTPATPQPYTTPPTDTALRGNAIVAIVTATRASLCQPLVLPAAHIPGPPYAPPLSTTRHHHEQLCRSHSALGPELYHSKRWRTGSDPQTQASSRRIHREEEACS